MDLGRKSQIAAEAINSISRHEDEDSSIRLAVLQQVQDHLDAERKAIQTRVDKRLAAWAKKGDR